MTFPIRGSLKAAMTSVRVNFRSSFLNTKMNGSDTKPNMMKRLSAMRTGL